MKKDMENIKKDMDIKKEKKDNLFIKKRITILLTVFLISLMSGVASAESINITGTLVEGVESGCFILNGDNGNTYQLFNLSGNIPPFGSKVYVNGTIEPNIVSYCMQGISIKVLDIQILKKEDILLYYRGLGKFPNIVETGDLLKASDDWRNNTVPPGYNISITTAQLLTLAEEWKNSK